jgi:hypothetical protein
MTLHRMGLGRAAAWPGTGPAAVEECLTIT